LKREFIWKAFMRSDSNPHLTGSSWQYLPLFFLIILCSPSLAQVPFIHFLTAMLGSNINPFSERYYLLFLVFKVKLDQFCSLMKHNQTCLSLLSLNIYKNVGEAQNSSAMCISFLLSLENLGYFSPTRKYSLLNEEWNILMKGMSRKPFNKCDYVIP
jgi:hypothetical protein